MYAAADMMAELDGAGGIADQLLQLSATLDQRSRPRFDAIDGAVAPAFKHLYACRKAWE